MYVIGQWATTPPRKPPQNQRGLSSLHACSAPPLTDGSTTPMTMFLCLHPLLRQCRTVCNEQLEQYQNTTALEQLLLPKLTPLVLFQKAIEFV